MRLRNKLTDLRQSNTIGQLARYAVTGGSAAVVDLGAFALLNANGMPVVGAASGSFALAALTNYGLTSRFVYMQALSFRRGLQFVAFALLGLVINVGVTVSVVTVTPVPALAAKLAGIGTAFLFNFWLNTAFVFRSANDRPRIIIDERSR